MNNQENAQRCWDSLTNLSDPLSQEASNLADNGLFYAWDAVEDAGSDMSSVKDAMRLVGRFDAIILGHVQEWSTGEVRDYAR